MYGTAAIGDGDRLLPARRELFEVGHGHAAAERLEVLDDASAERSRVEDLRPIGPDALERPRQLRLLEDAARLDAVAATHVGARELAMKGCVALQRGRVLVHLLDVELDQREALARQPDGRRESLRQRLAAVRPHQLGPAGEIAGHAD